MPLVWLSHTVSGNAQSYAGGKVEPPGRTVDVGVFPELPTLYPESASFTPVRDVTQLQLLTQLPCLLLPDRVTQ